MAEGWKTRSHPRGVSRRALLLLLLVPAVAGSAFVGYRRFECWRSAEALFGSAKDRTYRRLDPRLTYARADRHRPLSVRRDGADAPAAMPYRHLWQLERAGDTHAVVAAHVQFGQREQALARLQAMPRNADVESDRAAILLLDPKKHDEALTAADRALELAPQHPQAHWNRALILEALGLPLAAARSFRASAERGEPGWREEALGRAARADDRWQRQVAAARRTDRELEAIPRGELPSPETLERYPEKVRAALLSALQKEGSSTPIARLRLVASTIDRQQKTTSLSALAANPEPLRKLVALTQPLTVDSATEYGALARLSGEPWLQARSWLLLGQALMKDRQPEEAHQAWQRALEQCEQHGFVELCIRTKLWLATLEAERRRLPSARRWAMQVRQDSQARELPFWKTASDQRLQAIETFRKRFALALAYAEEQSLQDLDCSMRQSGREYLAKIAVDRLADQTARAHLTGVETCDTRAPRFKMVGAEALVELSRDPTAGWHEGFQWLTETLAFYRRPQGHLSRLERMALQLFEGRALASRDTARSRSILADLRREAARTAEHDEAVDMIRVQAAAALVAEAAEHGDFQRAMELMIEAHGVDAATNCLLGVNSDSRRWAYLVRRSDGTVAGTFRAAVPLDTWGRPDPAPAKLVQLLADCPVVGVLATEPTLGAPSVLPPATAWSYLRGGGEARSTGATRLRRLLVYDVPTPVELGLPRVGLSAPSAVGADENVVSLTGAAATAANVSREMEMADAIELHVHGILDRDVSDDAALVLAADGQQSPFFTAGDVQRLQLARRPGVILGACHGARSAGYGAFERNLSLAFMQAGARWVIASPLPVDDGEATAFFDEVWRRIREGSPAPVALRDARQNSRWQGNPTSWVNDVVLFY